MAALGLRCCSQAFSSCDKWGLLFVVVHVLLIAVASLGCGAWALGAWASVVVAHGLSCSVAWGIFPDEGSNPCPLHWQADSEPLCHQGSPAHHISDINFQFVMYISAPTHFLGSHYPTLYSGMFIQTIKVYGVASGSMIGSGDTKMNRTLSCTQKNFG